MAGLSLVKYALLFFWDAVVPFYPLALMSTAATTGNKQGEVFVSQMQAEWPGLGLGMVD